MNNNLTALQLLFKNDSFRFDPKSCRNANITLMEAKLLRWLFIEERNNVVFVQNFGMEFTHKLLKQGNIENTLVVQGDSQTSIWKISNAGLEVLEKITGMRS